ncbi:Crp/Fnr family transcriptional regulator [Paenibacillus sp. WQ 127069]|uniref:Crp/Fnr family transcriptional regulator n=1 Tax=Paenibacillus baimaensis TaxID=2982185 RepID=A0ABT2ULV7_9BACL|nr:Crp/Fnr family transcriptional regulator [Paenibacillus sp. WQ 127069]MCU6795628.1 Crp/Fnr family transcriptional regulator [Paenibacillus sp. WQ 127069]
MDESMIRGLMRKHSWLNDMLGSMPSDLFAQWEIRRYQPNDMVCDQGGLADYFCIVLEGEFKVEHVLGDGHLLIIAYLYPGQLISDIEIALGRPYVCRITAVNKAAVLRIKEDVYRKWITTDIHFLLYLTAQLSGKLYASAQKSIDQVSMSLRHKLIRHLYRQVEHYDFNEHVAFIASLSREDIASQWGVTVRSINRILKELKDRRIIFVKKDQIIFNEWSRYMMEKELSELENI